MLETLLEPAILHHFRDSDSHLVKRNRKWVRLMEKPSRASELAFINNLYMAMRFQSWNGRQPAMRIKRMPLDVGLGSVIDANLHCDIHWHAAKGVNKPVLMGPIRDGGETEAGDLEIAILIEKEILWLDIEVEDAACMVEGDDGDELLEIPMCSVLIMPTLCDTGEKLTGKDKLHDEVDHSLGGHELVDMNDVGVADATEDGKIERKGERSGRRR